MLEVALYIVSGLTLYAGGHHLYLGGNRASKQPHVQLGVLYLLLAGFALASAMTFQSVGLDSVLPAGKVAISFGLILWCLVVWHVAWRADCKPWLVLDALTAGWLAFLIQNLRSTNSLIYTDVTRVNQTLLNGETRELLHAQVSPWWHAVEITMLLSLVFCAYAAWQLYQRKQKNTAYAIGAGLGILAAVSFYDHLVSAQIIRGNFLMPFGFLGFLLAGSLYPVIRGWRDMRNPKKPPMIYNLDFKPDCASFHSDVSQLRTPLCPDDMETPVKPAAPARPFPVDAGEDIHDVPADSLQVVAPRQADATAERKPATPQPPAIDETVLHSVTDNLIDIAVYATMALNRFKRGDADPRTLENLCKKVRTRAIKTRRLANRLAQPQQPGSDDDDKHDD